MGTGSEAAAVRRAGHTQGMGKPRTSASSTRKGRPSKCTPERIALLEGLIAGGMGREAAAREAGIGVATWHEWIGRGRAGEEPYAELVRRIEGASEGLQDEVRRVLLNGLRSPDPRIATKIAMFLSERLWPQIYGRKQEITGKDGGPVQVQAQVAVQPLVSDEQLRTATPEQLEALVRGLTEQPA